MTTTSTSNRNPKIADLLAKAAELGITDQTAARKLLKANNVLTFKKLERVIAKVAGSKDPANVKSIDRATANAVIRAARKVEGKLKGESVHTPGPRGFRLGAVWLKSIVEGKGVALAPANLPKLIATAAAKGVDLPNRQLTQAEVAQTIAKAL